MKAISFFFALILSAGLQAAPKGVLVVGTQDEVRTILGNQLAVKFSTEAPQQMVAVRLTRGEVAVFEGEVAQKIIDLVGDVVKGGMAITLHVGSALWELLENSAHTVIQVGHCAIKAAIAVLCEAKCLVIDGVTFLVQTSKDVLHCVAELVKNLLP